MNRAATAAATLPPTMGDADAVPSHVGDTELRVSWGITALLVAPGLGILLFGLILGVQTLPGLVLTVLATVYLGLEALILQPRFAYHLPGLELERVALDFAHRRIYSRTLAELAGNFQQALSDGLGIEDLILILQGADGQLSFGGDALDLKAVRDTPLAVGYLQRNSGIVTRDTLVAGKQDRRSLATLALLNELEADIILSFSQGGQVLGFAIFDFPWKNSDYAEAFLEVVGESMTSGLINQHLRREAGGHEAMAQVFALAQAMQSSLLPEPGLVAIDSVQLQGWSEPAEQCGGDLWAWHDLGEGQVLLFVGDATGHGASPATLAAAVSGALAAHASAQGRMLEPDRLLGDLNALVREVGRSHHMMTAFAAVFDARKCEIRFANAGHNPPLLWRGVDDTGLMSLKVDGSMLGSGDELSFVCGTRKLRENDMLFLFSDGIVEAGEPKMQRLGHREFRKTLVECGSRSVTDACHHMKSRVVRHLGDTDAGDDMTFVALRFSREFKGEP